MGNRGRLCVAECKNRAGLAHLNLVIGSCDQASRTPVLWAYHLQPHRDSLQVCLYKKPRAREHNAKPRTRNYRTERMSAGKRSGSTVSPSSAPSAKKAKIRARESGEK